MKLEREKLSELRSENERREHIEGIKGMRGYVDHAVLEKAGVPLVTTSTSLTPEEFRELSGMCKRSGVQFSELYKPVDSVLRDRKAAEFKAETKAYKALLKSGGRGPTTGLNIGSGARGAGRELTVTYFAVPGTGYT